MHQFMRRYRGIEPALAEVNIPTGGVGARAHARGLVYSICTGMKTHLAEVRSHLSAQLRLYLLRCVGVRHAVGKLVCLLLRRRDLPRKHILHSSLHRSIQLTSQAYTIDDSGAVRRLGRYSFTLCLCHRQNGFVFVRELICHSQSPLNLNALRNPAKTVCFNSLPRKSQHFLKCQASPPQVHTTNLGRGRSLWMNFSVCRV